MPISPKQIIFSCCNYHRRVWWHKIRRFLFGTSPRHSFSDCAVCSKNYVSSRNFVCRECPDRTTSISIAAVVSGLVAAVGLSFFLYLVSRERERAGRRIIDRVAQRIPKQSVKIIIVVWQILTQVSVSNKHKLVVPGFWWRCSWPLVAHHEPQGLQ